MFWNPRQHLMEMLWSLWGSPLCPSKLAYDWISCQPPLGNQMRFDSHIHCCSSSNHCSKVFESVQFFERFTICSVQPKVEKARSCIHLTKENYPMSCIFSDILQLVQNPPREDNWSPSKLKLKRSYECQQHENTYLISTYVFMMWLCNLEFFPSLGTSSEYPSWSNLRRCPIALGDDSCGLVGGPCILFSRHQPEFNQSSLLFWPQKSIISHTSLF